MKRGVVELADHDEAWRDAFVAERDRVAAALKGLDCHIEHIGSTAVPNIPAKPILDIALGVPEGMDVPSFKCQLESLGYAYRGDAGDSGGHVFVRGSGEIRTHHLHAVSFAGKQWTAYLALRELLRSDATSRELYTRAKRMLAAKFASDRKSYTDGKAATVDQLLLKARDG